ncbi:hypothetical protein HY477_00470 [Candidatus Uhrbacteria bacterium]|nr:hypothetical protein [Candidatus Uhrbacteria bacterium]
MPEDEKLEKAKRELRLVGIVCVVVVVGVLWFVSLRRTFAVNRQNYTPTRELIKDTRGNLGGSWNEFQNQLNTLP